jgi:glycosyltransferase involved in cell wall biosynthesis
VPLRVIPSVHVASSPVYLATLDWRGRLLLRLAWRAYRHAAAVVAVSRGVADHLTSRVGLAADRVVVIHNPIVFPGLTERAAVPLAEPWYGAGAPPVILGIGRLEPQKDFATLIRAVALLRRERPVRLRILGEGPLRADLEAQVRAAGLEDAVQLPGFCANPFAEMRQAAVVVLSSIFEGFGNVLVEAMACGTAVVSTDCPSGPAEILEGGRLGPLVPVGDAEALAAAIGATLDCPPDPAALRARAEDFAVDQVVERYLAVLVPDRTAGHA